MIQTSAPHLTQADWAKVDASTDPAAYVAYLDRLEASPMVQRSRQEFLGGLPCRPGERVLDAGCQQVKSAARNQAVHNYEKVWSLMNLERTLRRVVETGKLSQGQVSQWRGQLEEAARAGRFCMHFSGTICIGWKEQG